MKKQALGAMLVCIMLGMTGCASNTPTPTAQPTTQPTTQAPTQEPTAQPTPAPTIEPATMEPEATALGPNQPDASGEALKDGTYRAEISDEAAQKTDSGWKGYLVLTVSGGDVTQAEFDYLKDGKKKSETTTEEYPMDPPPSEWIPTYQEAVLKAGSSGTQIDTVTGATRSAQDINALYQAALKSARAGDTQTVIIEEAAPQA